MANRERFLIVNFIWSAAPKVEELKPIFNTALDWYRLSSTVWIVWTSSNPETWFEALKPHTVDEDSIFIAELNLSEVQENYFGWQSKGFWDWIDKHRT
jgi:hypothetical protein